MVANLLSLIAGALIFVAGAFVTNLIASGWQRRQWNFDHKIKMTQQDYEAKKQIVELMFGLFQLRRTATLNYISSLRSLSINEILDERVNYREVVNAWNSQIPHATIRMRSAFSSETAYKFDGYFPRMYSEIDSLLGNARKMISCGEFRVGHLVRQAEGMLYRMHNEAQLMSAELLSKAESNREITELRPKISHGNVEYLTYSQLLKSLLKLRPYS